MLTCLLLTANQHGRKRFALLLFALTHSTRGQWMFCLLCMCLFMSVMRETLFETAAGSETKPPHTRTVLQSEVLPSLLLGRSLTSRALTFLCICWWSCWVTCSREANGLRSASMCPLRRRRQAVCLVLGKSEDLQYRGSKVPLLKWITATLIYGV